jgi:hypothetical protein
MTRLDSNFTEADGTTPAGGTSTGIGFAIAWQKGPCPFVKVEPSGEMIQPARNGAFLIEVLEACRARLVAYQDSPYACVENAQALKNLETSIGNLKSRLNRRAKAGKLGTHAKD